MTWPAVVLGAALILGVLREVFHTLFHPAGQGAPTMSVFRLVWAATGRLGSGGRAVAGPAAMALVIVLWTLLLIVGWALIYWAAMPEGFIFASPIDASARGGLDDALYLSAVTQATLGYGDIAPESVTMRAFAPLQALLGFVIFTAAVSWVLSVYPALQRQRATASLAHAIRAADEAGPGSAGDQAAVGTTVRRMERLTDAVATSRVDFVQFPSTFYFSAPEATLSLAEALPYLRRLAASADRPEIAPAAAELASALDELAETLGQHLDSTDRTTEAVIAAYRRHHAVGAAETRPA